MRWALILLLALPLSGCVSDAPAPPQDQALQGIPASDLEAGMFYAFPHAGGTLALRLTGTGGKVAVDLFSPDDQRLGGVAFDGFGAAPDGPRFDALPAGEYVLRTEALEGTLTVLSDGDPVPRFLPLPVDTYHVVLLDVPRGTSLNGLVPGLGGVTGHRDLQVLLPRAPVDVRLLTDGSFDALQVTASTPRGPLLEAERSGVVDISFQGRSLSEIPRDLHPENSAKGPLDVAVDMASFEGTLVLEVTTFSRARASGVVPHRVTEEPVFDYGGLPDGAVRFDVHPDAQALYLQNNDTRNATVMLLRDDGSHLGRFQVPAGSTLRIPVTGGTHVAYTTDTGLRLGSDAVPADFELRPVELHSVDLMPAEGRPYHVENATLRPDAPIVHIAPQVSPSPVIDPLGVGCDEPGGVRVLQDGEAVAAWEGFDPEMDPYSLDLLDGGPLTVSFEGYGVTSCMVVGLRAWTL